MKVKMIFFLDWAVFFTITTLLIVTILLVACSLWLPWQMMWSLFLLPIVYGLLVWQARLPVSPKQNIICERKGKALPPLTPGWYYPLRYFDLCREIAEVPMNKQMLCVLTGTREGFAPEIVEQYTYGTPSNIEPGTGDFIRLMYKLEFQCQDSIKLVYAVDDPYAYIVGLTETYVNSYVHVNNSEHIVDHFSREDWEVEVLSKIRSTVLAVVGIDLISFVPVDVINTPEVEEARRNTDLEKRKKEILEAKLVNLSVTENISKKNDAIKAHSIASVMGQANVSGVDALQFLTKDKTLNTILEASKEGSITYVDDSGNGNMNQAAALGWAIRNTQNP